MAHEVKIFQQDQVDIGDVTKATGSQLQETGVKKPR
jgi:hypothetical protein